MFEIEMKFGMPEDRQQFESRLSDLGAVAGETEQHTDRYFDHPCRRFVETGEALRLRRVNGIPHVTYKGPKQLLPAVGGEAVVKVREELEWCLSPGDSDGAKMVRLLESLGFASVASVIKARVPYAVQFEGWSLSVAVDTVETLGEFVEVECLAESGEDRQRAATVVGLLAEYLGCVRLERRSYLRMVLETKVH